jgi:5,10-methylenetetrahydrofolate reductase
VVTQMFFDNAKYFEFVAKAREMGITVPIIRNQTISSTKTFTNITANFPY